MSIPIKSIVLIVALFVSQSSQAQGLMLGFESNITQGSATPPQRLRQASAPSDWQSFSTLSWPTPNVAM
jgi:hypothetical protein